MAQLRNNGPYVWWTWLTKLLTGENSCEWAAWFKSQHESWSSEKTPSTFDVVQWQVAHTAGVIETRAEWEMECQNFVESRDLEIPSMLTKDILQPSVVEDSRKHSELGPNVQVPAEIRPKITSPSTYQAGIAYYSRLTQQALKERRHSKP